MINFNDLLKVGTNNSSDSTISGVSTVKTTFTHKFSDILSKNLHDDYYKNNTLKKQTNYKSVSVYNINKNDISEEGLNLISQLKSFLSNETDTNTVKGVLDKINKLLNNEINISDKDDFLINCNLDDSETELVLSDDIIQSILALLQNNTVDVVKDLNTLDCSTSDGALLSQLDLDISSTTTDDMYESINFIENKISEIFSNNYESNNNEISEEFIDKLMSLAHTQEDLSVELKTTEKEEILQIQNNLDISSVFSGAVESTEIVDSKSNHMHPITKQLVANLQAQLSSINLDNKTVELRLKLFPSKLGGISVVIEQGENGLDVRMITENLDVKSILSESLNDLKSQLDKFNLNSISVDISNSDKSNNKRNDQENTSNNISNSINYIEDSLLKAESDISLSNKILDIKF